LVLILVSATVLRADLPFDFTVTPTGISDAVYHETVSRFRLASQEGDFTLPRTGTQEMLRRHRGKGETVITIRTGLSRRETLSEKDAAALRADTRFLTLDSPGVREAAARLRGSADPIADVERFVHDRIVDKSPGIPLIPANEVLRLRRGDCTEHSVLSAALLRSLGVPSRALVGVYLAEEFMGKKDVFVYHMWVEAYRDGGWRMVDATRPGAKAANRYIAFGLHNLKTDMPRSYLRAIGSLRGLSILYCGKDECE
jgi:transglutaminase-like putative cysteine protease